MADFDLTQTDQQVQNILNDGQSAMGAGAQTTLTTEYVMLKDTSGVYHKILKSSFTEAIRDVLAGLLVNNDKGTTISQIPAIASGDFGSVTPANLASVLGDYKTEVTTGSLGDITDFGTYSVWSGNVQDSPISDYSFLLYVKKRGGSTYQIAVGSTTTNVPLSFMRVKYSNNDSWSAWKEFSLTSV